MRSHFTREPFYPENLNDYAPWVATHGLYAPYGKCQCGCGKDTPIAKTNRYSIGHAKGQPVRCAITHRVSGKWLVPSEVKKCPKCEAMQPLSHFYRSASRRHGYSSWCKACKDKLQTEYYNANRNRYAEYAHSARTRPSVMMARARYGRADRERYPEKNRARAQVARAIKAGRLTRLPCQFCGESKTQAHHGDYSKALDVIWVCFKCHIEQFHGKKAIEI